MQGESKTQINIVVDLVMEILGDESIDSESTMGSVDAWDSFAYIAIIAKISEFFAIEVTADDLGSFSSIKSINQFVTDALQ